MLKRILALTSTWDSEYSKATIAGILERIGDEDIVLHILNSYDNLIESDYFQKGREIYFLPDPDMYDGLIIALSTVETLNYVSRITSRFNKYNKPVVCIDIHADNAMFCGLDNYRSMYQLVEHMVSIHDCRTLNYLGGPEENEENRERFRAFSDCLSAHGIKVEKRRVLHKRFWKTDGEEAYYEWKERGVNMADAVICANDFMALGFIEAAERDGVTVPDYMKVTGFDNIEEAQKCSPSVTSVNRNHKQLGYEAMDMLLEALGGNTEYDTRFIQGYICYNESCGCDLTRDIRNDYNELVSANSKQIATISRQSYCRQILNKCHGAEDYKKALTECRKLLGTPEIAISINRSFFDGDVDSDKSGFDENMILYYVDGEEEINTKKQLYPAKWREKYRTFVFASLRNNNQTYGYMVMPYDSDFFTRQKHKQFVESLSMSLESVNHRITIDKLKEERKA